MDDPRDRRLPEPQAAQPDTPLGRLLARERRLALTDERPPDPARGRAGWERRFVADVRRAEEAMALYRELGYEVAADPLGPEALDPDCQDCQLASLLQFQIIYTRRRKDPTP